MEYCEGTVIYTVEKPAAGSAWEGIVGDRPLKVITVVEYGLAEEVIAMIEFQDGTFEVGIGESLRPYDLLYQGCDLELASRAFLEAIKDHTWSEE